MYEAKYPEVDQPVMIQVKGIADMGAYVSLLENNDIEGMILFSKLSRRHIRSISSLIKVGRQEPVMVLLRVDKERGYSVSAASLRRIFRPARSDTTRVSEKDDKLLQETMLKPNAAAEETENDEESEKEEDTEMCEIDFDNQVGITD